MVYKRYASLYFVMGIDVTDNELITLEVIHHYVEVLDRYFGNVCELDLIFNFHKARGNRPASASPSQEPGRNSIASRHASSSSWTGAQQELKTRPTASDNYRAPSYKLEYCRGAAGSCLWSLSSEGLMALRVSVRGARLLQGQRLAGIA